jgi:hypothetical protein
MSYVSNTTLLPGKWKYEFHHSVLNPKRSPSHRMPTSTPGKTQLLDLIFHSNRQQLAGVTRPLCFLAMLAREQTWPNALS